MRKAEGKIRTITEDTEIEQRGHGGRKRKDNAEAQSQAEVCGGGEKNPSLPVLRLLDQALAFDLQATLRGTARSSKH